MEVSRKISMKNNANYESLKFFMWNSRERFKKVKGGSKLYNVLLKNSKEIKEVFFAIFLLCKKPLRIIEKMNINYYDNKEKFENLDSQRQVKKERNISKFVIVFFKYLIK